MQNIDAEYLYNSVLDNLFMLYYSKTDNLATTTKEYQEKLELAIASDDSFREILSKELEIDYDKVVCIMNDLNILIKKEYFKEGFKQGTKLILEILSTDTNK